MANTDTLIFLAKGADYSNFLRVFSRFSDKGGNATQNKNDMPVFAHDNTDNEYDAQKPALVKMNKDYKTIIQSSDNSFNLRVRVLRPQPRRFAASCLWPLV